jgi:hypothetical protein
MHAINIMKIPLFLWQIRKSCVVVIPKAYKREGEREREAADVGERSQKGTCAWGDIAFTHSPVVFSS